MSEINKILKETNIFDAEALKQLITNRYEDIYRKAVEKGDLNNALKALDLIGKTNSLYVEKKEIDIKDNTFEIKFQ